MAGTFNLRIITPERIVLDTAVSQLTATARDGELSILPEHEPLVTALAVDALKYWEGGDEKSAAVIGGILEVSDKNGRIPTGGMVVTVLSDAAELGTEIDEARAKQAKQRVEAEQIQKVDKLDTQLAEMALARAIARIRAVEIANKRGRHR